MSLDMFSRLQRLHPFMCHTLHTYATGRSLHAMSRFVFLGAPGVGKGSFAAIIAPQLGLANIGVGDLLREEIKRRTRLGMELKAFSDNGLLAPDEAINALVQRRLRRTDAAKGFIMDGFPRNVAQAEWMDQAGFRIDAVINVTLPEWVTVTKLMARRHCAACGKSFNIAEVLRGGFDMPKILPDFATCDRGDQCPGSPEKLGRRDDDTEATIKRRLDVYHRETAPLVEYYSTKGVLQKFPVRKGIKDKDALVELMLSREKRS